MVVFMLIFSGSNIEEYSLSTNRLHEQRKFAEVRIVRRICSVFPGTV